MPLVRVSGCMEGSQVRGRGRLYFMSLAGCTVQEELVQPRTPADPGNNWNLPGKRFWTLQPRMTHSVIAKVSFLGIFRLGPSFQSLLLQLNIMTKGDLGKKGFIWLPVLCYSPSLREATTGSQGRN